jgi:hypothetical protein
VRRLSLGRDKREQQHMTLLARLVDTQRNHDLDTQRGRIKNKKRRKEKQKKREKHKEAAR